jgi:hypothetical protein
MGTVSRVIGMMLERRAVRRVVRADLTAIATAAMAADVNVDLVDFAILAHRVQILRATSLPNHARDWGANPPVAWWLDNESRSLQPVDVAVTRVQIRPQADYAARRLHICVPEHTISNSQPMTVVEGTGSNWQLCMSAPIPGLSEKWHGASYVDNERNISQPRINYGMTRDWMYRVRSGRRSATAAGRSRSGSPSAAKRFGPLVVVA